MCERLREGDGDIHIGFRRFGLTKILTGLSKTRLTEWLLQGGDEG
jgi:hypothetical protein